jgi:hypothetical protein
MIDEFQQEIDKIDRELLKTSSIRLQQVLREMEDYQLKILALHVEAQYLQAEMQDILEARRLTRLSKENYVAQDKP